ncbi:hypothetical protein JXR93_10905 [bacterium]|nr:hypothetical protein [bacterium]
MREIFWTISLFGLLSGLIVHIISLSGIYIGDIIPVFWLHIGIFIVWLPVVGKSKNGSKSINIDEIIPENVPTFMKVILKFVFPYAIINFMLFMLSQHGSPTILDGKFILQNKGVFIKNLTEIEYFKYKANEIRGFSGHWMLFYGYAVGYFWPKSDNNKESSDTESID